VRFKADGGVEFSSYINNLHPTKYQGVYRTIERLIEKAVPMWDQCLAICPAEDEKGGPGRVESRFLEMINPE
jgi:hypothetical protein